MIEIYLGRNQGRNKTLLAFCETHGISYSCKEVSQLTHGDILEIFRRTTDCFSLLSPSLQRLKCHQVMTVTELVNLILTQPDQHLRLPLIVSKKRVCPDVSLDEARTFLPRSHKVVMFRERLYQELMK